MMQEEIWRQIVDYPNYEVSDRGQVRRSGALPNNVRHSWVGRILPQTSCRHGYKQIVLSKNGKGKTLLVHRLVAEAFLGSPPSNGHEVAHNDGAKSNNKVSNLRWATRLENIQDKRKHGTWLEGTNISWAKLSKEQVIFLRKGIGSIQEIADKWGVDYVTIWKARKGITYKNVVTK